jgi:hypothetical protein
LEEQMLRERVTLLFPDFLARRTFRLLFSARIRSASVVQRVCRVAFNEGREGIVGAGGSAPNRK